MAELIDKGVLKEMFPCNGEGSWTYNVTAKAYIDSLPTTTEAEIRASAIDEFAEKLKTKIRPMFDYYYDYQIWEKKIDGVAEQLKEE